MAAKRYTFVRDYDKWKAGDKVTKTEVGDMFDALLDVGAVVEEGAEKPAPAASAPPEQPVTQAWTTTEAPNGTITATVR